MNNILANCFLMPCAFVAEEYFRLKTNTGFIFKRVLFQKIKGDLVDWKKRVYCGDVSVTKVGDEVLLMGWVDAIRDHGHILFIHLRDLRGIVQVVFDSKKNNENYKKAHTFRDEYIIEVRGEVALRAPSTKNPNLQTGEVEVFASELSIIAKSKKLPFNITEKAMVFGEEIKTSPQTVNEDLRLQYRYLDLRRPSMQEHFVKRYEIIKCIREYLDKNEFIELDTPVLTMSTPEGARDYLVPSRVHRGTFYALPQSPQIFKQLFMISGIDRYFQIVKCFRDEDLRPNRQPEFTQLDMEASFIDEKFIYEIIEGLTVSMFFCDGIKLKTPFPTMTYNEAMNRYGTDRPDVRFEMAFEDITDVVKNTKYGVFRRIIKNDGNVKGFCVRGQAERLSKNVLQNEYSLKIAPSFGAKGMSWMKVVHGKLESNIVQFFDRSEQEGIIERFGAKDGDVIIMIADSSLQLVNNVLGRLRLHIAERYSLIPSNTFCPLWVTEFPMFELDGEKLSSMHHPFTMPDKIDFDPEDKGTLLKLKSRAYDLVMNGEELGGGSVRINSIDVQRKVFQALGLSEKEVQAKFGFFLRALEYGAPPHAGLALGLDRVLAMILNLSSIRDVIPFPKNRNAVCPLTSAPSYVDSHQIKELGLDVDSIIKNQKKSNLKTEQENDEAVDSLDVEKITEDEVKHIARLARLELNESEIDSYKKDINTILKYVDILNELNTEKIEPMRHVLNVKNVWREDEPGSSKMAKTILTNAPVKEDNYFKVPKILEG